MSDYNRAKLHKERFEKSIKVYLEAVASGEIRNLDLIAEDIIYCGKAIAREEHNMSLAQIETVLDEVEEDVNGASW